MLSVRQVQEVTLFQSEAGGTGVWLPDPEQFDGVIPGQREAIRILTALGVTGDPVHVSGTVGDRDGEALIWLGYHPPIPGALPGDLMVAL